MKKHELLQKAMKDYPKGTKYHSVLRPTKNHISTGVFWIDGSGSVTESPTGYAIYTRNKWAEIIPDKPVSIFDGKVAVQVSNYREFKLLMEHYESKGWLITNNGLPALKYYDTTGNGFSGYDMPGMIESCEVTGRKVIPFADFAKEVGIEVPVFCLRSEDGVDLYSGDECFVAVKNKKWYLDTHSDDNFDEYTFLCSNNGQFENTETDKVFSTRRTAEAWIAEQNKPKEVIVNLYGGGKAKVNEDCIYVFFEHSPNKLSPSDLEDMLHAYKSLR